MDALGQLPTEARNPASARLDEMTAVEIVALMNREDAGVASAVAAIATPIARAIDAITERMNRGGRLIYCGAGTSGRLGVLDAAECPPTFQTDPSEVIGLIAGGHGAMFRAVEGAEDNPNLGEQDLAALELNANDVVVGIAASGRTPYVLGALNYSKGLGAFTISVTCVPASELAAVAELDLSPIVGPEILTGSTRLKSGTATKLVLNMLTTGAMVRRGKAFGNLMVDLRASNQKLKARANRIVRTVCATDEATAAGLLERSGGEVKTALVMHLSGVDAASAREKLVQANGRVVLAVGTIAKVEKTVERTIRRDLVLGFDGGGTQTTVLLAEIATGTILGRGVGGASNIQAVGVENGLKALDDGVDRAFAAAGIPRSTVTAACLGLAGIDRQEGLDVIHGWAGRVALAETVRVANDATLLLAAGTPEGWGLAVIAGTGSIAFVRTQSGTVGRCGGWGHLLGDEGSAYRIAVNALMSACRAADGVGPPTDLLNAFPKAMNLPGPPDLIPAVYRGGWDRTAIAGLCPIVLSLAADGDDVAAEILASEAWDLANTAAGAVRNHGLPTDGVPIALAGGVLLKSEQYRLMVLKNLRSLGVQPGPVALVEDPAIGAVTLACQAARSSR
jgi:N-acetylmuramic acid 6-phosphate etherase